MGTVAGVPTGVALPFEGVFAVYAGDLFMHLATGIHRVRRPHETVLRMVANTMNGAMEYAITGVTEDTAASCAASLAAGGVLRIVPFTPAILAALTNDELFNIEEIRARGYHAALAILQRRLTITPDYAAQAELDAEDV